MPLPRDGASGSDKPGKPVVKPKGYIDWGEHGANQNRGNGDDDRPRWKPSQVGDKLTGTIVRAARVTTKFGERTVLEWDGCRDVVAEGEELVGPAWMAWATQGLIDCFADIEAREGGTYTIELDELIDTNKGNPFFHFTAEEAEAGF